MGFLTGSARRRCGKRLSAAIRSSWAGRLLRAGSPAGRHGVTTLILRDLFNARQPDAIVDAVVVGCKITVANGYLTEAGNVFRWRSAEVAPMMRRSMSVIRPAPPWVYNNVVQDWELAVECSAFASSGVDTDGLNRSSRTFSRQFLAAIELGAWH
jgi:hypothetical protein